MRTLLQRPYLKGLTWEEKTERMLEWARKNLHISTHNLEEAKRDLLNVQEEIKGLEEFSGGTNAKTQE